MTVREKQGFAIRVKLRYHKPMPETSVNLNITRSDGVYAFYQPSGLDGTASRISSAKRRLISRSSPIRLERANTT